MLFYTPSIVYGGHDRRELSGKQIMVKLLIKPIWREDKGSFSAAVVQQPHLSSDALRSSRRRGSPPAFLPLHQRARLFIPEIPAGRAAKIQADPGRSRLSTTSRSCKTCCDYVTFSAI